MCYSFSAVLGGKKNDNRELFVESNTFILWLEISGIYFDTVHKTVMVPLRPRLFTAAHAGGR